jgi:hypothetical protein
MADLIGDIRLELDRLGVTYPTVSRMNEITVTDHRDGNVALSSANGGDLQFGTAPAILERLRKLPTDAGPERVRTEFA